MGSAMGVFGTIWDTGEAGGPILAGFLIASFSYPPAFGLIGGFMAVMALVFFVTVKDPSRVPAEAPRAA
ncbi:MAG: MFS transporter, partial [Candidatus Rokubacteria bacterium]|nr:MFS transporter [Candidatus Rokubacteria bacterium]